MSFRRTDPGLAVVLAGAAVLGQAAAGTRGGLADASLEDLMKVEVTSVSRRRQPLSKSAAAVYVITREDIVRSGATSIPEVLRLAPGLMVARIDSNKWAVGARGKTGRFADEMLVLIDGRSVYTSLYSGVYWEQNDSLLEDIDRIEIIRGPGGTMWGANAVSAVINIITKAAAGTPGLMVTAGGGTLDRSFGAIRYGGKAGARADYRGHVKYFRRGELVAPGGGPAQDGWSALRGGGRLDWAPSRRDSLTVHGDLYRGDAGENVYGNFLAPVPGPVLHERLRNSGGYALGRWEHVFSGGSDIALQAYVQRENRNEAMGRLSVTAGDFDFQHYARVGARHAVLWGAAYRLTDDRVRTGPLTANLGRLLAPEQRRHALYSAFVQDEFALVPERLVLTAGTKVQHNAYTGVEVQPNARLLWTPGVRHAFWGAISRAVRTPSRRDADLAGLTFELPAPAPPGSVGVLQGNRAYGSETLVSYETGWRWQPGKRLNLDVTAYLGQTHGLQQVEPGVPVVQLSPVLRIILPLRFVNGQAQKRGGVEAAGTVQVSRGWRAHANYSWYHPWDTRLEQGVANTYALRETPYRDHQAQIRNSWELRRGMSFDLGIFASSGLPATGIRPAVRVDARLAVRSGEEVEWSLTLQDLLSAHRREFVAEDYVRSAEVGRAVCLKMTWGR